MNKTLHRFFIAMFTAALVMGYGFAHAAITSISVFTEPITVGQSVIYTANMNGANGAPTSTTWDYRATEGMNQGPWIGGPMGYSMMAIEDRVGSYSVRATTTFTDGTTGALIRSVTVNPPDRDVIISGVNVASAGGTMTVQFDVRNGTVPMGPGTVDGIPQERIRRPAEGFDIGFVNPGPN